MHIEVHLLAIRNIRKNYFIRIIYLFILPDKFIVENVGIRNDNKGNKKYFINVPVVWSKEMTTD